MSQTSADARRAGLVASAAALATLYLASSVFDGVPFAPAALADLVIRITPGDLATALIELLGHWGRRLLTVAAIAGSWWAGASALVLARSDGRRGPYLVAAGLGALAAAASLASPSQDARVPFVLASSLAAGAVYAVAARKTGAALTTASDSGGDRRRVLRLGAGAAVGVALGASAVGWLARRLQGPNTNVALVPPAVPARLPGDRDEWPDIPGLTPEITSVDEHYVVDINIVQPSVEAEGWRLRVSGEVDKPLELSFAELQDRFEVVQEYSVLTCVSNEVGGSLVGHSAWGGVRLWDLLEEAGIQSDAVDVVFRAADGYSDSITLPAARDPHTLLAISQNGKPLRQEHGFPCRARVPSIYGMKNVKWLEAIEVVPSDFIGYWQERGWSDGAVVKTESRIDVAGDNFEAKTGRETWIAGVAWAGDRGVTKVEVSVDGGSTWAEARLKDPVSEISWRLWAYAWTPGGSGQVSVLCRATDGTGTVQTAKEAEPHPNGASGYHEVSVGVS